MATDVRIEFAVEQPDCSTANSLCAGDRTFREALRGAVRVQTIRQNRVCRAGLSRVFLPLRHRPAVTMRSVKGADDLSVILAFYGEFTIFVHEAARFSIRFRTRGLRIRLRFFNFAL